MKTEKIKVIHVDDDHGALKMLYKHLSERIDIKYLDAFTRASDAAKYLDKSELPDILFLDVEMPENDGFWLAKEIAHLNIDIVFVTSSANYALMAFEACALDYLLKPIDPAKLNDVIERYYLRRSKKEQPASYGQIRELFEHYLGGSSEEKKAPTQVYISMLGKIQMVLLKDVLYFTSAGNYSHIYMANGEKFVSTRPLRTYIDALTHHHDFVRTHRSYMVNRTYVAHIIRDGANHKFSAVMSNGEELPISYSSREDILGKLGDN